VRAPGDALAESVRFVRVRPEHLREVALELRHLVTKRLAVPGGIEPVEVDVAGGVVLRGRVGPVMLGFLRLLLLLLVVGFRSCVPGARPRGFALAGPRRLAVPAVAVSVAIAVSGECRRDCCQRHDESDDECF
jgi:hypothetical protein